ncbi:MAG: Multi-sensor signal transduction histidine kinase [Candidatus Moranbacteria bacterium GW2011_GWD1_36_198]|nr:MAG: Multi-sensor signal transduction histidine kinase [Candidatus Moranbacteria bacterium GW2011_GWD1_36_198]
MFGNDFIFFVLVSLVSIFMGLFVLLKDTRNRVNRNFFYLSSSVFVWIASFYFEDVIRNQQWLNVLLRSDYFFGCLIVFYFFLFIGELVELKILSNKIIKVALYLPSMLLFWMIFFTDLIVKGFEILPGGLNPILGSLEIIYEIFLVVFLLAGSIIAAIKYRKIVNEKRVQLAYIFTGLFIFIFIAILINVVLVDLIKNSVNYTFYSRLLALGVIVLSLVQLFTAKGISEFISQGLIFVALTFFAYKLVRSVEVEIERKEELQEMATRLAQANDQLRTLDNAKTEFISIASHQLRTPITAIKGFSSLLLEGSYGEVSESVHSALEKVYSSAERLVDLVEDLLNVSRIESGRMQFTFEKASVEKLIKELYDNFILIAKNKKFYLDIKLPENPLPEIVMDYSKIRELVSNFIDNALKYTEKGGATVKAELREEGVVVDENGFVVGKKSEFGKVIRITVSDTGIGIPKEEIPYLFKKFSRGKDVSRLHVGGTGLGLYVGKAIAETHHGQVWVESDGAGKGSRFIIEIPVEHIS